jgi:hypothetical protein
MNQIKHALLSVLAVGMVGCSPKVTSEMLTNDFEPQPTNYVMIIGAADEVPAGTGAIGHVVVNGKGVSVRNQYGKILNMAVQETAQKGGNVLVVDTVDSKKNRLKATIGFTYGDIDHSLTLSPSRIDKLQRMNTIRQKSSAPFMDKAQMQAVMQQQDSIRQEMAASFQQIAQNDTVQASANTNDSWEKTAEANDATVGGDMIFDKMSKVKTPYFKVSVGSAKTISDLYADDGKKLPKQSGFCMTMSYGNFTDDAWYGWGLDAYLSRTKIDERIGGNQYSGSFTLGYFGPSVVLKANLSDRIRLYFSTGLGVAYCNNEENSIGYGSKADLGLELLIAENLGIGVESMGFATSFKAPSGVHLDKNERYGYDQSGWMFTARYHF